MKTGKTLTELAAEGVPGGVRDDARGTYGEERIGGAEAVSGGEGPGGEEERNGGHRDAKLLHQHPYEEDGVSVCDEEVDGDRHGELALSL